MWSGMGEAGRATHLPKATEAIDAGGNGRRGWVWPGYLRAGVRVSGVALKEIGEGRRQCGGE